MTIIQALILGIVQGLAEMLPISSSAHLNIIPWILGWTKNPEFVLDFNASFDLALHFGTLIAIILFFYKDWITLIKAGANKILKKEDTFEGKLFWNIVIATIFAGILAIILDKISEKIIGGRQELEMGIIATSLIVMGIVLYIVDKKAESKVTYKELNLKQTILIGISQGLAAAFPGVSRSGITITVARALKIDRESAAKISFLLSTPIVALAVLAEVNRFALTSISFWVGIVASFIVGLIVIKILMEYLKKGSFKIFAIYRVILGLIIFGIIFIR